MIYCINETSYWSVFLFAAKALKTGFEPVSTYIHCIVETNTKVSVYFLDMNYNVYEFSPTI